ncbi:protein of unknown function DUF503 [Hippea maritima DSM 10411]|uniref:YlxP-like protein n=2 Tax=Hippea TaxID=84404 RepID=F2LVA5_HIPMA|nr:protein of unknown function DUF503 [Hippea maritima DSM 10411]
MEVDFKIDNSFSLKDKRRVVRSLIEKTKNSFNVSVAEVDNNDVLNMATIGIAVVSNSSKFVDVVLNKILDFWEHNFECEIIDVRRDVL